MCSKEFKKVQPKTRISLNFNFYSRKIRINLDNLINFEEITNQNEVLKRTVADYEILAMLTVVRIVKRAKRISQTDLIASLIDELKALFKFDGEMLKRSIDKWVQNIHIDDLNREFYVYNN